MNELFCRRIKEWVDDFTGQFMVDDEHITANLLLKLHHTYRVETEIKMLAESLALSTEDTYIARVIALLHDVGRFPQFAKYGTYSDRLSESH
ncbi:MAG: HD domain-containing protein, partial [Candidatus Electryoneaceae bacterium]|nr:HD domain-containing protein [Candidatus Electryoneaceae bacterium]